jgi:lactoylglutathione lyase
VAKVIHAMIRVLDLDASIDFYSRAFNLDEKRRHEFEGFSLVYLGNGENDFEIELTLNHDKEEPYSHGSGYGHIAVCVDDLDTEHARIKSLGFAPRDVVVFSPGGDLLARFFFVTGPDGYEIEVIERHGAYR